MKLELHRGPELGREPRRLPAAVYNLAHTLLAHSPGPLFVPIRSMQVLAVIDREEILFVDSRSKQQIEIAWQHFAPRSRSALDEPVPYELVLYSADSALLLPRLLGDFTQALQQFALRQTPRGTPASILTLPHDPPG